ncbi:hypothetical protein SDC9_211855 [bioreactor metagenome]|uniref:Uncharacterized protein n=1 Tax=bioreactor metagenome TaxID=1076179 RepID=A0A645JWR3_9ZZZZ
MDVSAVCRTARTHIQLPGKVEFGVDRRPAGTHINSAVAVDNSAGNHATVLNKNASSVIDGGADGDSGT